MSTTTVTSTSTKTINSTAAKPARGGRRKRSDAVLPDTLRFVSPAEALQALHDLDTREGVVPAHARGMLLAQARQVTEAAARIGLQSVTAMVSNHRALLKALTGQENIAAPLRSFEAEQLHTYRNLLLALILVACDVVGGDTTAAHDAVPTLAQRSLLCPRPLFDDEVLLLRTFVSIVSRRKPSAAVAGIYAMVDAGMTPGETTMHTRSDMRPGADGRPANALAPGNGHLESRYLPLDRFNANVLDRLVRDIDRMGIDPKQPMTYKPRRNAPGSVQACASAQGVIDRLLADLGLANTDVTASSIRTWRLTVAVATHDTTYAQVLGGFGEETDDNRAAQDRLWRAIGFPHAPDANGDIDTSESFL